jgi:hypothetical protein
MQAPYIKSLALFSHKIRFESFKVGYSDNELFPVDMGYDRNGKSFVHGKGYIKLKKQFLVPAIQLDPNALAQSLTFYFKQFGIHVLRYALGIENTSDCVCWKANDELRSFLNFPDCFFEFYQALDHINIKLNAILTEKWHIVQRGDYIELPEEYRQSKFQSGYSKSIDLKPSTSIMGMFPMQPHHDWISYEKKLDNFILAFSDRRKSYEDIALLEELANQSVKQKMIYILGEDLVNEIELINNFFDKPASITSLNKEAA